MRILLILLTSWLTLSAITIDKNERDFTLRYGGAGKHVTGDIASTGGSVICEDGSSGGCNWNYTGYLFNLDPQVVNDDASFTNSSTAKLTLPPSISGSDILWAGLYWQGHVFGTGTKDTAGFDTVQMRDAAGTLHTITSTQNDWYSYTDALTTEGTGTDGWRFFYQSFADVTSIVKNSYTPSNTDFTVGNILATMTEDFQIQEPEVGNLQVRFGNWGGWNLVVVYEGDYTIFPFKNVAIYDGFKFLIPDFGGGTETLTIDLPPASFYTPITGSVSSRLTMFAAGAEKGIYKDNLEIWKDEDENGLVGATEWKVVQNSLNPGPDLNGFYNQFNDSITYLGNHINPTRVYNPGIDVDTFDTTDLIANKQTTTKIRASMTSNASSADQTFIGQIGISVELFVPRLCYDYAYAQHNTFFTEINSGALGVVPHLKGDLLDTSPILTRLYLRNEEIGSTTDKVTLYIEDLNTSEAVFPAFSDLNLSVTQPNTVTYAPVPSSDVYTLSSSDLTYKHAGVLNYNEGVYSEFYIHPNNSGLIDIPLNMSVDINYTFGTQSFGIPKLPLRDRIPLCSAGGQSYSVPWGKFNIEDANLAGSGKYNLSTQVANRPFSLDVVSYDPNNLTVPQATLAFVAIDIIDADSFQGLRQACNDPKASLMEGQRVWVTTHADNPITPIDVQDSVNKGFIDSLETFYGTAKKNAALRVAYLERVDGGTMPIEFSYIDPANPTTSDVVVTGFPDLQGKDCAIDPRTGAPKIVQKPNGGPTSKAPVACGNAGSVGVPPSVLQQCLECLFESNVVYTCSRDNFAIRPEAFKVKIFDNQQSDNAAAPTVAVPYTADLAAGYDYRYDVDATWHGSTTPAPGYTQSFQSPRPDQNITYYWRPNNPALTGCNDTADKFPSLYLLDGQTINEQNRADNVGRYELEMRDSAWTKVDQNPDHHVADPVHFNAYDCILNNSTVPAENNLASGVNNNNIGCTISSSHVDQDLQAEVYSDYNITVHPYQFNVDELAFQKGALNADFNITANNAYVYMNSITNLTDDLNMSVRYKGFLKAQGADFSGTSNFVRNCYAKDLNLNISTSALPNLPFFSYRLRDFNSTTGNVSDDTIRGKTSGFPSLINIITLPAGNFLSSMKGEALIELNLNFDRNTTSAFNPQGIVFNDFNTTCIPLTNCQSRVDMQTNYNPFGDIVHDQNISFLYARQHIPRHRQSGTTAQLPINYEFFCDQTPDDSGVSCNIGTYTNVPSLANAISPLGQLSPDDVRWYIQSDHNTTSDGNVTFTQTRDYNGDRIGEDNNNFTSMLFNSTITWVQYIYNGAQGYPYKVTMETPTPDWLIYNRYDTGATINQPGGNVVNTFELEFTQGGNVAGKDNSNMSSDSTGSATTNRRIQW